MAKLLAVSDLHVEHAENRDFVASLRPESEADWLIVAGDVGDSFANVEWALGLLAGRFARVIWTPGNHGEMPKKAGSKSPARARKPPCRTRSSPPPFGFS